MSKLVIFDGNAIMHRAYHAMPPMRTTSGDPISAVYGLTSMLLRVVEDLKPSHLAFAFDRPEPTFRKKLLEAYQSHRPEMAEDLGGQFEKAYEVLQAMGIPVYDKAGYEADDVIGTIAKMATTHVIASKTKQSSMKKDRHAVARDDNSVGEVVVVTGDRDMLQLVNDKTKLYMSERGLGKAKLYGDNETKERMGVAPERIVDLKGLMGDSSDNYKGVPGVGPKTAMNLLDKYESFEGIYKNLDKLPEKQRSLLEQHRASAEMSYKLAKIMTDIELDFELEEAGKWKLDSQNLIELFNEYGFKTLTERVKKLGKKIAESKQQSLL